MTGMAGPTQFNDSVMAKPLVNHLNEIYIGSEDGTMHKFSANGEWLGRCGIEGRRAAADVLWLLW